MIERNLNVKSRIPCSSVLPSKLITSSKNEMAYDFYLKQPKQIQKNSKKNETNRSW